MCNPFAELWWLVALRGLAGIALGTLAFVWPALTLEAMLYGFGIYAVADGALALYAGVQDHDEGHVFWPFAVEGAIGVLFGAAIVAFPDPMAMVLWYLVAAWAVGTGAFEILVAVRLRRYHPGEALMGAAGVASVALAIVMFVWPRAAMITHAWLIGAYAIIFGGLLLALALRLRRLLRGASYATAA